MIEKALQIALDAHKGQVDKGGKPYILHPLWVASKMDTEEEIAVALLHDVLEDSNLKSRDLLEAGLPTGVVWSVVLLTKNKHIEYDKYIGTIKHDPVARKVKLADLKHNMQVSRLLHVTERDCERLEEYVAAYRFLSTPGTPLR